MDFAERGPADIKALEDYVAPYRQGLNAWRTAPLISEERRARLLANALMNAQKSTESKKAKP